MLKPRVPSQLTCHGQSGSRWRKLSGKCENGGGGVERGEITNLEADILQVLCVLLDDLLNEVRVSGAQVRRSWLIELKLKSPPQVRGVKDVVPAAAHGRSPGAVHQGQMLEDLQHDVVRKVAPVCCRCLGQPGRSPLLVHSSLILAGQSLQHGFESCPSPFHSGRVGSKYERFSGYFTRAGRVL